MATIPQSQPLVQQLRCYSRKAVRTIPVYDPESNAWVVTLIEPVRAGWVYEQKFYFSSEESALKDSGNQ